MTTPPTETTPQQIYDCIVIGAGPAGLSAAIYLGRFLRRVLVLDSGEGRSSFSQVNENYLGFPMGVQVQELRDLGRQQASRFGAEFIDCNVERLRKETYDFAARTNQGMFYGRTVILCTGVCDIWPTLPDILDYVGKTLFWCITCDGFRTIAKEIVLFGCTDEAATTACQFKRYTDKITFIHHCGAVACSEEKLKAMTDHGITIIEGDAEKIEGTPDQIEAICLKDGRRIPAEIMFSLLGCTANNMLATDVGAKIDGEGYVVVDQEGYTTVPGLFCAGDLSKTHSHQIVSAAHEGAEAAQTANYYLYERYQKN